MVLFISYYLFRALSFVFPTKRNLFLCCSPLALALSIVTLFCFCFLSCCCCFCSFSTLLFTSLLVIKVFSQTVNGFFQTNFMFLFQWSWWSSLKSSTSKQCWRGHTTRSLTLSTPSAPTSSRSLLRERTNSSAKKPPFSTSIHPIPNSLRGLNWLDSERQKLCVSNFSFFLSCFRYSFLFFFLVYMFMFVLLLWCFQLNISSTGIYC